MREVVLKERVYAAGYPPGGAPHPTTHPLSSPPHQISAQKHTTPKCYTHLGKHRTPLRFPEEIDPPPPFLSAPGAAAKTAAAAALLSLQITTHAAGCVGREVHVTGAPVVSARECADMIAEAEAWAAANGASTLILVSLVLFCFLNSCL